MVISRHDRGSRSAERCRRRRVGGRTARLLGEVLEPRLCLALAYPSSRSTSDGGSVNLTNSVLTIRATDNDDNIYLYTNGNGQMVLGVYDTAGKQLFSNWWWQSQVSKVAINAGKGGDLIDCTGLRVPTEVHGNYGSDLMIGGLASDVFYGDDQEDLFIPNKGTDWQDTFYGGGDNDGLLSRGTSVTISQVDSVFGRNLPFDVVGGWQRSASGKWEMPIINVDLSRFPSLFNQQLGLRAALTKDGLALIGTYDTSFFQGILGVWGGSTPYDQSWQVSATADRYGDLTWRLTTPYGPSSMMPYYGDVIDALNLTGQINQAETTTIVVKWSESQHSLLFGLEYDLDHSASKTIAGIPASCRAGVTAHAYVTISWNGVRKVTNLDSLVKNFQVSYDFHARVKFGLIESATHCGGELTNTYVRYKPAGFPDFTVYFNGMVSVSGLGCLFEPEVPHAVFVVDTLDDLSADPSRTSLRSALEAAAITDAPVDICFSDALATGVPGAVNTIQVGVPFPYSMFSPARPLAVNNRFGRPITIDASAIGGIRIAGQGIRVGDESGPTLGDGNGMRGGSVSLKGITFDQNSGASGGAIEVFAGASLTLDDCILSRNASSGSGGAVFVHGPRASDGTRPAVAGAQVTVVGGGWSGNRADGDGGVVAVEPGATLVVAGDLYAHDNTCGGSGGVIWSGTAFDPAYGPSGWQATGGSLRVSSGMFWNNSAAIDGGAIWAREATVSLDSERAPLSFMYNSAGVSGGAIAIVGDLGLTSSTVAGADIRGNTAGTDGGAVAIIGDHSRSGRRPVAVTIRSNLAGNRAAVSGIGDGGGLFAGAGTVVDVGGSWIDDNTVGDAPDSEGHAGPKGAGGGVYIAGGASVTFGANASVSRNAATNGGGIFISAAGGAVFAGERIDGNSAALKGGGIYVAAGGAMECPLERANGELTLVTGNSAATGGGIFVASGAGIALAGSIVSGNVASVTGGGIQAAGSDGQFVTLRDVTVSGNAATAGGGIFLGHRANLTVSNAALIANIATSGAGGGVKGDGWNVVEFANSYLLNNTAAAGGGGGIELGMGASPITGGTLALIDTRVEGNSAFMGGGVLVGPHTTASLVGTVVGGNAARANGGGIRLLRGALSMTGGGLEGNAAVTGGGLAIEGGTVAIEGAAIAVNQATIGGGVSANASAVVALAGVTIRDNVAAEGGGLSLAEACRLTVNGGRWVANSATRRGGGASIDGGASVSADGLIVESNGLAFSDAAWAEFPQAVNALLDRLGITFDSAFTPDEAAGLGLPSATGVRIEAVVTGGAAQRAGFRNDDVIVACEGVAIDSFPQLMATLGQIRAAARAALTYTLVRGGQRIDLKVTTPCVGGGFAVAGGTLSLLRSAVFGNVAGDGGAMLVTGPGSSVTAVATALAGNAATRSGGAVWLGRGAAATLAATTVAWNTAGSSGGGIAADSQSKLALSGTIVARNAGPAAADISGAVVTGSGFNLVGIEASGGGIANGVLGNQVGSAAAPLDPRLAAFGTYGGSVPTIPLLPGSPAIDAGSGVLKDQRGVAAVGRRDIGCFESRGFRVSLPTANSGSGQVTAPNSAFALPLTVQVSANYPFEPVAGGRIAFSAPTVGASASVAAPLALITAANDSGGTGTASTAVTANGTSGSYAVAARVGTSSVPFALTNRLAEPLAVSAVTINSGAVQRSNVTQLEIRFSRDSNVASLVSSGAITSAVRLVTAAGVAVSLAASRYSYNAATLTLAIDLRARTGGGTMLADGRYEMRLDTTVITVPGFGVAGRLIDGDGTADGVHRVGFHALAGDADGDGTVSIAELNAARAAFAKGSLATLAELALYDFGGDGRIDGADYTRVQKNLGRRV